MEQMDEIDLEIQRMMEARGILPEITVLEPRSGRVLTYNRNDPGVQRDIAAGAAIETVPRNPDHAAKWLAALRERVVAEWSERQLKIGAKYLAHDRPLAIFEDYEQWCAEKGVRALPAEESSVVGWLLARVGSGAMEAHNAVRAASIIADFHHFTRHPPASLARPVCASYERAISFAKARLRTEMSAMHVASAAPAKAAEMFPDGIVPRQYHEVAA